MTVPYGSIREKRILAAGFLAAASLAYAVMRVYDLHHLPYLKLPLFLGFAALLLGAFPHRRIDRSPHWRRIYRAAPVLFIMAAVSIGSSFSFPADLGPEVSDSLFHGAQFFVVGLLMARWVEPVPAEPLRVPPVLLALTAVLVFALLDELHQAFVPGRQPSLRDILSDLVGGAAGILAYRLVASRVLAPARNVSRP